MIPKRDDGWWNLKEIARSRGREIADFLRLASTRKFIDRLAEEIGRSPVERRRGNRADPRLAQGTWGHPALGVRVLIWASLDDEVQICLRMAEDFEGRLDD